MKWILPGLVLLLGGAAFATWQLAVWPFDTRWVQIVSHDGEPLMGALLVLQRPGEPEPDFADATNETNGWLEIPRGKIRDGAEMAAVAPGCGVLRGALPEGKRIVLPRAVEVTLKVPGDFPLPEPPGSLVFSLIPVGAPGRMEYAYTKAVLPAGLMQRDQVERIHATLRVDPATRSAALLVPRAGRWKLRWSFMVYERKGGGMSGVGTGPGTYPEIEIPEGGGEVAFPITAAELARQAPD